MVECVFFVEIPHALTKLPKTLFLHSMINAKTVALHTLGCKLNFSETSTMGRLLEKDGFQTTSFEEVADIYVINTCSVTDNADKECRQLVRRVHRKAPEAMVVITGCYAQLKPEEVAAIQGVDLVLGAAEKFKIHQHVRNLLDGDTTKIHSCEIDDVTGFTSSYSLTDRTRTFMKIQEGCDYNCSYCTIPMARGRSRSQKIEEVLKEIDYIVSQGVKEIVFTGINLGDFGRDGHGDKTDEDFFKMLRALEDHNGAARYRISSIEPNLLSDDIIRLVAQSSKVMPHFHIPLQSGSNKILGLMRRRYRRELYQQKVEMIKELIPHCGIGVDVITGFPGETEEDFMETYSFLSSLNVSYFHVFTYSERANTVALDIEPVVPVHERHNRTKMLRALSFRKTKNFEREHAGTTRKVLFEGMHHNGMMEGYTDNYIKVSVPFNEELTNQIVDWELK